MTVEQLEKEIKRLRDQPEAVFDSNKWMVESHRSLALAQLEVALHTAKLNATLEAFFLCYFEEMDDERQKIMKIWKEGK